VPAEWKDGSVGTVLVLAIAAGVGVLVYRLTAGPEVADAPGSGGSAADDADALPGGDATTPPPPDRPVEPPEGYIPVASGRANWHSRLGGAMGLVIAVAVGAIALALSVWALVELVSRMFADAGGAASGA
jgi:hypothetical protein